MIAGYKKREDFGYAPDGQKVFLFTIAADNGITVKISDYGGIVQSLLVPDRNCRQIDIVQGFETAEGYHDNAKFIGVTIGRYTNAIKNGVFELNGIKYNLNKNYGNH